MSSRLAARLSEQISVGLINNPSKQVHWHRRNSFANAYFSNCYHIIWINVSLVVGYVLMKLSCSLNMVSNLSDRNSKTNEEERNYRWTWFFLMEYNWMHDWKYSIIQNQCFKVIHSKKQMVTQTGSVLEMNVAEEGIQDGSSVRFTLYFVGGLGYGILRQVQVSPNRCRRKYWSFHLYIHATMSEHSMYIGNCCMT